MSSEPQPRQLDLEDPSAILVASTALTSFFEQNGIAPADSVIMCAAYVGSYYGRDDTDKLPGAITLTDKLERFKHTTSLFASLVRSWVVAAAGTDGRKRGPEDV